MTATMAQREIGHPWFDRHAIKGAAEIFEFSHYSDGTPRSRFIRGCLWATRAAMREYYGQNGALRHELYIVSCHDFASWEEAKSWLRAQTLEGVA